MFRTEWDGDGCSAVREAIRCVGTRRDADGDMDFWDFGFWILNFWLLDSGQGTSSFGMFLKASVGWIRMRCMI